MGKNKKSKIKYNSIEVDSIEEYQFFCWVDEAKALGILLEYEYQPEEFALTNRYMYVPYYNNAKQKSKPLLREHIYTSDFKLVFDSKYGEILSKAFKIDETMINHVLNTITVYVDVKGAFNKMGGDRLFSIHQKLIYDKFRIYVNKIVPKEFFTLCGIAKASLKTPTGRASKIFASYNFIAKVFNITQ